MSFIIHLTRVQTSFDSDTVVLRCFFLSHMLSVWFLLISLLVSLSSVFHFLFLPNYVFSSSRSNHQQSLLVYSIYISNHHSHQVLSPISLSMPFPQVGFIHLFLLQILPFFVLFLALFDGLLFFLLNFDLIVFGSGFDS